MNQRDISRLNQIRAILTKLNEVPPLFLPNSSDNLYELYCYFHKLNDFMNSGKEAIFKRGYNSSTVTFRPHFNHGIPRAADYFCLENRIGSNNKFDLILNGIFPGSSGISHSPDIALTKINSVKVMSFFECKNYPGNIGPEIYREMIGYCKELGIKNNSTAREYTEAYPVLTSSLLTSAKCGDSLAVRFMKTKYNFDIIEGFGIT